MMEIFVYVDTDNGGSTDVQQFESDFVPLIGDLITLFEPQLGDITVSVYERILDLTNKPPRVLLNTKIKKDSK
jgi:hypothetical protein